VVQLEPIVVDHPQLEHETRVREALAGGVGIPFLHWSGVDGENNAAVSDLLGPSLEDMFKLCNRKFSLKTVFLVAVQLISRIEYCHSKSFIHRDIRPENFYLGRGKLQDQVHISNFGLAKKYTFPEDSHIPYTENRTFVGSARYASLNGHRGIENSRRDDMESLGYVMLYFCRGSLPWQGLHASTREEKWMRIMEKKRDTPTEVLCRGLPDDFLVYLNYTRSLRFDEKPNYDYLRDIFRNGFHRESFQFDYVFDWTAYLASKGLAPPVFRNQALSVEMVVNEVKCSLSCSLSTHSN
jgi:casein kinase I family protein HRR25